MDRASNEYLRNAVMTATPEQLHLMLYDGAIRFTRQGVEALRQKNWEGAYNGFTRAQKIILEMNNSLNYDVDRPLCERMASLYTFIYKKLVEAAVQRDVAVGEEILGLIQFQRETWVMVIKKLHEEHAGQSMPGKTPTPTRTPAAPQGASRQRVAPARVAPQTEPAFDGVHGSLSLEG